MSRVSGTDCLEARVGGPRDGAVSAVGPLQQSVECRTQQLAPFRELVLHLGRNLWIDGARHNAVVFELAQLLCQHLLGNARSQAFEVREALHLSVEEVEHYQQFPAARQTPEDRLGAESGNIGAVVRVLSHGVIHSQVWSHMSSDNVCAKITRPYWKRRAAVLTSAAVSTGHAAGSPRWPRRACVRSRRLVWPSVAVAC